MLCEYECYLIGGPWISENPDCPKHGSHASCTSNDREESMREILHRVWLRDLSADAGYDLIEELL